MPSKPFKRHTKSNKKREVATASALAKLYSIGTFDRNQVTIAQIDRLRDIIDLQGFVRAAELTGLCQTTLLKVTSGFAHKLRQDTAEKIREFFQGK